jgi:hypothetical protein
MPENENRTLVERFGSAKRPGRSVAHHRPEGLDDGAVAALGKLSEALEVVEQARGFLYGFHRLSGTADRTLQEAVGLFRDSGQHEFADELETALVGRDIIHGCWSFQLVEEYDSAYWQVFRAAEQRARARLGDAAPHVFEAEMKQREQSGG